MAKRKMKSYNQLTDSELITEFYSGNEKVFNVLMSRYTETVKTCVSFLTRDRCLVEDITQETFLKALRTLRSRQYHDKNMFQAWIKRIAKNTFLSLSRKQAYQKTICVSPLIGEEKGYDFEDLLCDSDQNPEEVIITNEIKESFKEVLNQLDFKQQKVLFSYYYKEMSLKDIAEQIGVGYNTCLGISRYGRHNMRKIISENNLLMTY